MMSEPLEISDLIADVREQVLFLQELGVDALAVELTPVVNSRQLTVDSAGSAELTAQPNSGFENRVEKAAPPEKLELPRKDDVAAPRSAGSRLSALPSLKDRKAAPVRK